MNPSNREKTEQPTPKKLRDVRKKGQVENSREIVSTAVIAGALLVLWTGWDFFLSHLKMLVLLPVRYLNHPFEEGFHSVLMGGLEQFVILVLPIMVTVAACAVLAHLLQYGLIIAVDPIKPDLNKLNPVEGFKKIFTLNNLIELMKSIFKMFFLSVIIYWAIKSSLDGLVQISGRGIDGVLAALGGITAKIVFLSMAAFGGVALFDHFFQKYLYRRKHKMTKEEVRQEYKEMYGNPLIKGKRQRLYQELSMNAMLANMRKASVVVTNPTHLAIALFYDEEETGLPIVLAKGQDYLAEQIVKIAQEENIPIMQNIPLAHDLYKSVEIDDYIPRDLIKPVAEVIRWVWRLKSEA